MELAKQAFETGNQRDAAHYSFRGSYNRTAMEEISEKCTIAEGDLREGSIAGCFGDNSRFEVVVAPKMIPQQVIHVSSHAAKSGCSLQCSSQFRSFGVFDWFLYKAAPEDRGGAQDAAVNHKNGIPLIAS